MSGFLDLFIVMSVLGAARAGWARGFIFRVIDFVGFVVAVLLAVKLHRAFGAFFDAFGVPPKVAPFVGGLVVFVAVIVVVGFFGRRIANVGNLPGLSMANRVLGAALGAATALVVVAVAIMALRSTKLPLTGVAGDSKVADTVVAWVAPVARGFDATLSLGLCEGRFASRVEEVCSRYPTGRAEEKAVQTGRPSATPGGPSPR